MAGVCGRDCRNCDYRQEYGCLGCLETGGNPVWGSCRATACCHSQGMQNCGECPTRGGCGMAEEMERIRQQWALDREARFSTWREELARRVPLMTQWLPVLFWLNLASMALNLLGRLPLNQGLSILLSGINLCLSAGALVAYWKLSVLSDRLRLVWRLEIGGAVAALGTLALLVAAVFFSGMRSFLGVLALLVTLALLVICMVVLYHFCESMAEETEQSDPPGMGRGVPPGFCRDEGQSLASSWRHLRKCTFWSLGVLVACLLLAIMMRGGILLLLVALAAALVLAGCSIAQLVMLWRSGRFFRELPPVYEPLPPAEEE